MQHKFRYQKKGVFIILFFGVLSVFLCCENSPEITPLLNTWDKAIPYQEIPEGLSSLSAEHCGACHQDHYEEWKESTHAHAWTDQQFQTELKKESSPFMCINCHIPLQNQQEYIVMGLENGDIYKPVRRDNPKFDSALQKEGITCASCHVRNNKVIGPTGTSKAPHATVKDKLHLSENLCIGCHNAVAVITEDLACSFETGDEWKNGPFYDKKNCLDCHMESIEREIVPGYGVRKSRYHSFAGSGIPKDLNHHPKKLDDFKVIITGLQERYTKGDTLSFNLEIINDKAGHNVPSGDPERFIEIVVELMNDKGSLIKAERDTIGEKWQWHPIAKKLFDNNLKPNEKRNFHYPFILESNAELRLRIRVNKHRLNIKSAEYNKLGDDYPLFIPVFEKEIILNKKG